MLNKKYIIIALIILLAGCTNDTSNINTARAETITNSSNTVNDDSNDDSNNVSNTTENINTIITDTTEQKSDVIDLKSGTFDTTDLTLFDSDIIELNLKSPITIKLYCSAAINEDNVPMFDDGNYWALIAETSDGYYEILNKTSVQLGDVNYTAYFNENDVFNILIKQSTTANYSIDNFTYDEDNKRFEQNSLLDLDNINNMAESSY